MGKPKNPQVVRRVHFFKMEKVAIQAGEIAFDLASMFQELEACRQDPARMYRMLPTGDKICTLDDCLPGRPTPRRLAMSYVQMVDINPIEDNNTLVAAPLQAHQGPAITSHYVFFDKGVVGCEYPQLAPQPNQLAAFFHHAHPKMQQITIRAIPWPDVLEKLRNAEKVAMVEIHLNADGLGLMENGVHGLGNALGNAAESFGAYRVKIALESPWKGLAQDAKERTETLFRSLSDVSAGLLSFKVRMDLEDSLERETIDFVSKSITVAQQVPRPLQRDRELDRTGMYEAIEKAYENVKPEIDKALAV